MTPLRFVLPTEDRWEYACRAGATTAYSFGNNPTKLGDYAWFGGNTQHSKHAHEVGQKQPNAWGLWDMHGNVWEWCKDAYDKRIEGDIGPIFRKFFSIFLAFETPRVLRGGSWRYSAFHARCSLRNVTSFTDSNNDLGFRVLLEFGAEPPRNKSGGQSLAFMCRSTTRT